MDAEEISFSNLGSDNELKSFLLSHGFRHSAYYHYTDTNGLIGMLKSKKLHLSLGKAMNDLVECSSGGKKLWERTYVASFTYSHQESIAMWSVYSRALADVLRIKFLPSRIWEIAKKKIINYYIYDESKKEYILQGAVEDCQLTDVAYYRENSLKWKDATLRSNEKHSWHGIEKRAILHGCLKHVAWEYEKEVRLCIILPEQEIYPKKIAIDAENLLFNAEIMRGPCLVKKRLLDVLNPVYNTIPLRCFPKNNLQKKVFESLFFDKLHLPAKCEHCKFPRKDCPGTINNTCTVQP